MVVMLFVTDSERRLENFYCHHFFDRVTKKRFDPLFRKRYEIADRAIRYFESAMK
jgi:hypothetical protein